MKWMSSLKTLLIAAVAAMSFSQPARAEPSNNQIPPEAVAAGALALLFIGIMSAGNNHRAPDDRATVNNPREKAWPARQRMDGYAFYYKKPLEKSGRTCRGIGGTLWTVYSWDGDKQERRFHCYVGNDRPDALDIYFDGRFRRTYDGEMWLDARTNTWKYGTPQIGRDDHRTWNRDRDDRRTWDRDRDRDDRRGVAGLTIRTGKRGEEYYSLRDLERKGMSCKDVGGREKQITLPDNTNPRVCML